MIKIPQDEDFFYHLANAFEQVTRIKKKLQPEEEAAFAAINATFQIKGKEVTPLYGAIEMARSSKLDNPEDQKKLEDMIAHAEQRLADWEYYENHSGSLPLEEKEAILLPITQTFAGFRPAFDELGPVYCKMVCEGDSSKVIPAIKFYQSSIKNGYKIPEAQEKIAALLHYSVYMFGMEQHVQPGIRLYEICASQRPSIRAFRRLGELYSRIHEHEKARECYFKAEMICNSRDDQKQAKMFRNRVHTLQTLFM